MSSKLEGALQKAISSVPECVAAGYVDLSTGMLLGIKCVPSGSERNACEDSIDRQLDDANPDDDFCEGKLDTCEEPSGESFCSWILTEQGKIDCGLAYPSGP